MWFRKRHRSSLVSKVCYVLLFHSISLKLNYKWVFLFLLFNYKWNKEKCVNWIRRKKSTRLKMYCVLYCSSSFFRLFSMQWNEARNKRKKWNTKDTQEITNLIKTTYDISLDYQDSLLPLGFSPHIRVSHHQEIH